jgi:hypothetical protein
MAADDSGYVYICGRGPKPDGSSLPVHAERADEPQFSSDDAARLAATLADLSTTLRYAARAAGEASAALWKFREHAQREAESG